MKLLLTNKKSKLNYHVLESYECGVSLVGPEVKSLSKSNGNIDEAFVFLKNHEAYLINMYIAPFKQANINNVDPYRKRKLLLHKNQIIRIEQQSKKAHLAIIPIRLYFQNDKIKIEIALCKSKNVRDKRQDIKIRDLKREAKNYH
ncbi:MAG: SsrA-binding protein SmpB [Mycoplasmataceae bacterium]|jgi:SsrA-binding protein|nr:SsrA-binding protein SmpB [Mycoplasmataceae bacterium]